MDHPEGAGSQRADRVDFDRRVRVEFRGAQISSDGGLLVMRELDDALGLSDLAAAALRDTRPGKNTIHRLVDGVMDFFANKGSLTVLDFPGGDGWDVLCGALGKEIPSADFPIRNVRREKGASSLDVV